jgi:hypothetical protein
VAPSTRLVQRGKPLFDLLQSHAAVSNNPWSQTAWRLAGFQRRSPDSVSPIISIAGYGIFSLDLSEEVDACRQRNFSASARCLTVFPKHVETVEKLRGNE